MPQDEDDKIKKIVQEVLQQEKATAQEPQPESDDQQMQKCALACSNARNIALQTLQYCLAQGGKFSDPFHFNKIADCAEICELAANFLLRDSENKREVLRVCFKVCSDCEKYCDLFTEDKQMQICAKYAQQVEESCRQII